MQLVIEIILLCAAVLGVVCVLLAAIYDAQRVYSEASLRSAMRRMTKLRQPQVSIVITNVGSAEQLLACLRNIKKSHYKRYDIVAVMKNAGTHERQLLKEKSRIKAFRIYTPRREVDDNVVLVNAYRRTQHGEIVMVLSAQDMIEPTTIKKSVTLLQQDDLLGGVKLFGELEEPGSMTELHSVFSELSKRILAKAFIVAKQHRHGIEICPGVYDYKSITKALKEKSHVKETLRPGLTLAPAKRNTHKLTWYEWASRLVFVAVVAYISLTAAMLQSYWPFIMTWIIVCLWLVAVIWSDETLQVKRKVMMSVTVPIGMFVVTAFYIVSSFTAMFRIKTF